MKLSDKAQNEIIRRPDEPDHLMRLRPIEKTVCVSIGDTLLAQSQDAVRLLEIGHDIYDPVVYLPRKDVKVALSRTETSTHCPLKGDASYFDAALPGDRTEAEIAWSYEDPLPHAREIGNLVAFDPSKVTILERPD